MAKNEAVNVLPIPVASAKERAASRTSQTTGWFDALPGDAQTITSRLGEANMHLFANTEATGLQAHELSLRMGLGEGIVLWRNAWNDLTLEQIARGLQNIKKQRVSLFGFPTWEKDADGEYTFKFTVNEKEPRTFAYDATAGVLVGSGIKFPNYAATGKLALKNFHILERRYVNSETGEVKRWLEGLVHVWVGSLGKVVVDRHFINEERAANGVLYTLGGKMSSGLEEQVANYNFYRVCNGTDMKFLASLPEGTKDLLTAPANETLAGYLQLVRAFRADTGKKSKRAVSDYRQARTKVQELLAPYNGWVKGADGETFHPFVDTRKISQVVNITSWEIELAALAHSVYAVNPPKWAIVRLFCQLQAYKRREAGEQGSLYQLRLAEMQARSGEALADVDDVVLQEAAE